MTWAIVSLSDGFEARPLANCAEDGCRLVARHPDEASAVAGMERAQSLEKTMRPLWLAAVEHELRVRNAMLDAVYRAAKPIEQPKERTDHHGI